MSSRKNPRGNAVLPAALLLWSCVPSPGLLAADDLATCAAIDDGLRRLACYDRVAGRPGDASGPSAVPATPAAAATAAAAAAAATAAAGPDATATPAATDPVADFGLTAEARRRQDPERGDRERLSSIESRVVQVKHGHYDRFVLELENGQVWQQSETMPDVELRPGDTVTIKRAALGSFMLVNRYGVATRVRRQR
jgi:hypothetical protein